MRTLPELPSHVGLISDPDNERLESLFSYLPSDSSQCETCSGTKRFQFYENIALPESQRKLVEFACNCYDQFVLQRYLLNSGVGKGFANLFWGDTTHVHDDTSKFILDYAKNIDEYVAHGLGLFLYGEHGTGKSLVASLLLKRLLERGVDGYWVTLNELLSSYQETWRGDKETRAWFDRRMRNVRVLVVDDMGREYDGRTTAASTVDTIFRTRVQNGLVTIVTTNLSEEKFIARYTKGIQSLVTEACVHHEAKGEDFRKAQRERAQREVLSQVRRPFTFGTMPVVEVDPDA